MKQPTRCRVFYLLLCLAFALAILGTMDRGAGRAGQPRLARERPPESTTTVADLHREPAGSAGLGRLK